MKKAISLAVSVMLTAVLLTSCGNDTTPSEPLDDTTVTTVPSVTDPTPTVPLSGMWQADDTTPADTSGATVIRLEDRDTAINGEGAEASSAGVTVTKGGVYVVSGQLTDGQLRVDVNDGQTVYMVLDGVTVHSNQTAPLFVRRAEKVVITLADGSENRFSDSAEAVFEDAENEEPSGAVFSKSDLTINGNGSLTVEAAFRDGIVSRDGLKIAGGKLAVTAADDALMGRDYVLVGGGDLTLRAAGDGIKSTNDASAEVGFVEISGGTLTVESEKDGVQAESSLSVSDGVLKVVSGGGSQKGTANDRFDSMFGMNSVDSSSTGKALKAGTQLAISGGTLTLDAADDALHSNDTLIVSGGAVTASAGDDGVHADTALTVSGGSLEILTCYEGLEAATITVEGGNTRITASDDGVNASSGSSDTTGDYGPMGGRGGMGGDPFASDDSKFYIRGGKLFVDAEGDGLDSNGSISMTGGEVTVIGPSNSGNGTFDFASSFDITGGSLIAIGSSGMAQTPTSDTLCSIVWGGCTLQTGESFSVTAEDGTVIASVESTRTANWAYVLSPALKEGESYTLTDGYESRTITHTGGMYQIGYGGQMGGQMGGGGPMGGHGGMGRPGGFF